MLRRHRWTVLNVLHYVSLNGLGGVELQFSEFIAGAQALEPDRHRFVACGGFPHPHLPAQATLGRFCVGRDKYLGPIKLPSRPRGVRRWRRQSVLATHQPDVVVIWNRLRDGLATLRAAGPGRCLYWERGAAWFPDQSAAKAEFLRRVPAALCNSIAAKRMLQLRWGYGGDVRVVPNAVRPSLLPERAPARSFPSGRCVRLGVVARLVPVKGVALAIHALALLRGDGLDAQLHIAGDGPERGRLAALAAKLGLGSAVEFHGLVRDMPGFYAQMDCLIHPALREPFGQIVIEAAAYGCPAIVANVDGLPETLVHGETGVVLQPQLPIGDYPGFGGKVDGLPPYVYDPLEDRLTPPRLVAPEELAAAVARLCASPGDYVRIAGAAVRRARTHFDFRRHLADALAAMHEFAHSGALGKSHGR